MSQNVQRNTKVKIYEGEFALMEIRHVYRVITH